MFAASKDKRWSEKFFLLYSPVWVFILLGIIVPFKLYEDFEELQYFVVGCALSFPCVLVPLVLQKVCCTAFIFAPATELWQGIRHRWEASYALKANLWIAIFGFVGNYFLTHYFFALLGASYTFVSWRLNDVPLVCFLLTQPYFLLYHTIAGITLRWVRQKLGRRSSKLTSMAVQGAWILSLGYVTALAEALTIANFSYYYIARRDRFYKIGSILYALYFFVSFPMFSRIDEDREWTITEVAVDALAASMLVMIMLELWKHNVGAI